MPRRARLEIATVPQLVLQRGISPLFRHAADYDQYRAHMLASSAQYGCAVHAYALLPDQIELLVTGSEQGAVSRMMQSIGRRYAGYANERDATRGPRWQGRYHSCPVGGDEHILRAYAHVELSPSRAADVPGIGFYEWSSYGCNALGTEDICITPHRAYLDLSRQTGTRRARYRDVVARSAREDESEILMHIHQGCAWGDARFLKRIATELDIPLAARPRGRPRKAQSTVRTHAWTTLSPFLLTGWIGVIQTLSTAM